MILNYAKLNDFFYSIISKVNILKQKIEWEIKKNKKKTNNVFRNIKLKIILN